MDTQVSAVQSRARQQPNKSTKLRPPSATAIETQFEISRETCYDLSDSYSVAKQTKSHKMKTGAHLTGVGKKTDKPKLTVSNVPGSITVSEHKVINAQYSKFESRRRPKSAKAHQKSGKMPYVHRSKSTFPFSRSVTPHTRSPTPRPSSVTLTPKTVTPRLTKCKDLKSKTNSEPSRQVFSAFKPKSSRSKSEEETLPDFFRSGPRSNNPDRVLVSRSFTSTPASYQGPGTTTRPLGTPRSTKELFCNCASGQPKVNLKYCTNLTSLTGHEATKLDYEKLLTMWSTQGLHWIRCTGGEMCSRAVEGGHTRSGEPLYIARAFTPDKNKCIGTYHPSTGLCYIPWKGKEIVTDNYELLCYRSRIQAPASVYNYTPNTNLVDTLKVLTLRDRRQTAFKC